MSVAFLSWDGTFYNVPGLLICALPICNYESDIRRKHFGFKSTDTPTKMQTYQTKGTFQKKLKEDIPTIKQSPNVFVFARKICNIHEMPEQQYKKTSLWQRHKNM